MAELVDSNNETANRRDPEEEFFMLAVFAIK